MKLHTVISCNGMDEVYSLLSLMRLYSVVQTVLVTRDIACECVCVTVCVCV